MFIMNIQIYKKWEFFRCKELQKSKVKNKLQEKRKIVPPFQITDFFSNQRPHNKLNLLQHALLEYLV